MTISNPYQNALRRLLIDMHIPDWDEKFLREFDPVRAANEAIASGANGVMVYFQSHVGLCNWPTKSGQQHGAFNGTDPMRLLIDTLKQAEIGVCGYYSTMFNTWASNAHPDWQIKPATPPTMGPLPMARYGLCCPNHPEYRAFVREQATEIATNYSIDTFFFDMMWWPAVCLCDHCQSRCESETGAAIPAIVNWNDPAWCAFQTARENWIAEFATELKELVHEVRPGTSIYHNFALAMSNWSKGVSFDSIQGHDFLGGDFYGGRDEQLVISKLMLDLSPGRPTEFMTTIARNLIDHEQLQSEDTLKTQVYGAIGASSAFLMIAAVDPDGQNNPEMLDRSNRVFEQTKLFEPFIGGQPIEDIGVYFSDDSKMNFADNGTPLADMNCGAGTDYPHFEAIKGACNKLSAAHLPFGVLTRQLLDELDQYKVIVLPNVLRMNQAEIDAFRKYVRRGGNLYASRLTSLNMTDGTRNQDFALADVFGCHFTGEADGRQVYCRPASDLVCQSLAPERFLGHRNAPQSMSGAVRIQSGAAETLASLSLPYGYPHEGTTTDQNWASIHSDPPWEHLDEPSIVSNTYGKGRVIFCAADIEAGQSDGCNNLFLGLINHLLDQTPSFRADAHPAVWVNAFWQPKNDRVTLSFLNYQLETPIIPLQDISFEIAPPTGKRFVALHRAPEMEALPFELESNGRLIGTLPLLEDFAMLIAEVKT